MPKTVGKQKWQQPDRRLGHLRGYYFRFNKIGSNAWMFSNVFEQNRSTWVLCDSDLSVFKNPSSNTESWSFSIETSIWGLCSSRFFYHFSLSMLQSQLVREQLQLFKMFGQKYLSLKGLMIQILGWLHESFTQQKTCEFVQRASNVFYRIILQFRRSNLLCRCHLE